MRHQGWCIVDQELEQGLRSLAVPVYDSAGHVLAAMNVSTHAGRVPVSELEKRYLPLMLSASRELSSQLAAWPERPPRRLFVGAAPRGESDRADNAERQGFAPGRGF